MKFICYYLFLLTFIAGCTTYREANLNLASISIVDANGTSEIISNEDRLRQYQDVDFLIPQPYKKVMRVYKRDHLNNIAATITTYHPNGELKQYLDVINGRASGDYGIWYENGIRKIQARVIGGPGDLYDGVENSWLFDGYCFAYAEDGLLEAEIPYIKGKREGTAVYYHKNGAIWKHIPLHNDTIQGCAISYYDDGSLFEKFVYDRGKRDGAAERHWKGGSTAALELYENDRLISGRYFYPNGDLVSEIVQGNGFRAVFSQDAVHELQEYQFGIQEGIIKVFAKKGNLCRSYHIKDGMKNGEEIEYNPFTNLPILSISWYKNQIQGLVKTWYPNGQLESQREMVGNKRSGILTAWYADGGLMLLENYELDKLMKGDYYKKDDGFPVSNIINGEGTATLFDSNGQYIRKINYRHGVPDE